MGNIGIDVSKEELARQCGEANRIIHNQKQEIKRLENQVKELLETRRKLDSENEQLKKRVEQLHERLDEAYKLAKQVGVE